MHTHTHIYIYHRQPCMQRMRIYVIITTHVCEECIVMINSHTMHDSNIKHAQKPCIKFTHTHTHKKGLLTYFVALEAHVRVNLCGETNPIGDMRSPHPSLLSLDTTLTGSARLTATYVPLYSALSTNPKVPVPSTCMCIYFCVCGTCTFRVYVLMTNEPVSNTCWYTSCYL